MVIIVQPTHRSSRIGATAGRCLTNKKRSDADMIRSRLLFKLGIYDSNFTNASMHHKHHKVQHCNSKKEEQPQQQQSQQPLSPVQSSSQEESQDTVRGSDITITYLVPLKIDQDPQEGQASSPHLHLISDRPSSSSLSASSSEPSTAKEPSSRLQKRRSRLIQFDPSATVIPVPSHRSYSPDVHAQIHVPKEELAYNTARNTREFIYEGWDWRNVVEEDGMYVCRSSREHVHPAHVGFAKRRVNPYL